MVARDRHQNDRTDVPRLFRKIQKIWNLGDQHLDLATKIMKYGTNWVAMPRYGPILTQFEAHTTHEAFPNLLSSKTIHKLVKNAEKYDFHFS